MAIQYRRKVARAGGRDMLYSPERDLAHIGPGLIGQAMLALDEQWQEPWFKDFMAHYSVSEDMLGQGAQVFAKALNRIVALENPVIALEHVGFDKLPPPVQMALYCKIGQVLLAGVWSGVKDISLPESKPPADIEDLLAMSDAVMRHFGGQPVGDVECELPSAQHQSGQAPVAEP